jgi:hypothetical protein
MDIDRINTRIIAKERIMEEEKKERSGSVTKVRAFLNGEPRTHADLKAAHPELSDGQISMAIAHLKKRGLIEQEKIARVKGFGRKEISAYRLKA